MVFEDDYIQLCFDAGYKRLFCAAQGIPWPPPERILFEGFVFKRNRFSALTDEQRKEMTHVCRGAEYFVDPDQTGAPDSTVLC